MTIAIGMQYQKGVLIAADTKIIVEDGSVKYGPKLQRFVTHDGIFALAASTPDGRASKTLANKILNSITIKNITTQRKLEDAIVEEMSTWHALGGTTQIQYVLGACLKNDAPRFYLCEPPATFVEHTEDGYVGCGSGSAVTDPLHKMLFGTALITPATALRMLSYLMYRAKKDSAHCGGKTHCVLLEPGASEPRIVNSLDLEAAETQSQKLDFLLHSAALFALCSTPEKLDHNAKGLGDMLKGLAGLRAVVFHDVYGEEIKDQ